MEFCEIRITKEPLEPARLNFAPTEGAVVDFFGVVRATEDNRIIDGIEYEAFEAMAERQLALIGEEARERYRLASVIIHHRIGFVRAGEASLFVRVTARHRRVAFEGSSQIVERLKEAVPIWKHPVYADAQIA
ncbi:MAG: molybdenum cofactor biosynthesis protein MoaE [Verrucomicrobia bacterium]|jgi:molybdopterin synthase catalytic subunit|nr:molybdenum cofactor biosynthesis protein MoaE [Verrucomicrobiota bacterium]MBV8417417.1 molybdenum cofactor biosynthesis protein MoaE [Verrucomicrobiota bacterium]